MRKGVWKDFTREIKIAAKRNKCSKEKKTLIKYYEEKIDAYFTKLEREIHSASQIKGGPWEWAGILLLKKILQP